MKATIPYLLLTSNESPLNIFQNLGVVIANKYLGAKYKYKR